MTSRVTVYNPQGERLTELSVDFYREWKISEYGAGRFDISVLDPTFKQEFIDFGNWVLVEHDKLPAWVGTIESPRDWNGGMVTVNCLSGEARLKRALTRKDTKYHGTPGHVFSRFVEDSCSGIVGLKMGNVYSAGSHITVLDNFACVYDLIVRIAEKRNNDWNVEPEVDKWGNLWFACNWYGKIGTVRTTRLFEDKHVKSGVKMTEQGEMYNSVIVKGAKGSWAQGGIGIYTDYDAVSDYGLYEFLLSDNTSKEEDDHIEYAMNYVKEHKEPRRTFTLGLVDVNDLFSELRLGDTFTLETYQTGFTNNKLGYIADIRILQMNYKDSENVVNIVADEVERTHQSILNVEQGSITADPVVPPPATGDAWYVDLDATGANNGTSWTDAWQSFASIGWAGIDAGDTIYISDGTYSETLTVGASGSSGLPITIDVGANSPSPTGHDGTVIIDGGDSRNFGIYINAKNYVTVNGYSGNTYKMVVQNVLGESGTGKADVYINECDHIIIQYVKIWNGKSRGFYCYATSNLTIRGNDVQNGDVNNDVETDCIFVGSGSSDVLVENNLCKTNNADKDAHVDCLQIYNVTRATVRNNFFESPTGRASNWHSTVMMLSTVYEWIKIYNNVCLGDDHADSIASMFSPLGLNASWYIWNNTFVARNGGEVVQFTGFVNADLAEFKNNIMYTVGDVRDPYEHPIITFGTGVASLSPASKVNYNLMYRSSGTRTGRLNADYTWAEWQALGHDVNGVYADPVFVTGLTDVHIQTSSPCKNAGADLSAYFTTDKDGVTRPSGQWDIGAYEFIA